MVVDDTQRGEDGLCPLYDDEGVATGERGDCPVMESSIPLGDVSITWALRRSERDCRLINYRTGEVAGPASADPQEQSGCQQNFW